jgi:MarR family 2-MHQ and catechol resistance regulon transcriptional repressor
LPVTALSRKVLLTSGSMTAAVDRLERSGLVTRAAISTDRRSRIVHLTAKGSKFIRKLFREHERDMERVFSLLNKVERNALAEILRKLGREAERMATEEELVESKQARR